MKRFIWSSATLCMAILLSACGNTTEPSPASAPAQVMEQATTSVAPPAPPAPPASPAVVPEPVSETKNSEPLPSLAAPSQPGAVPSLTGTKWTVSDFTIAFTTEDTALVSGGPLTSFYPNGLECKYACDDGKISLMILGKMKEGTWDGTELTFSGVQGRRLQ